MDELKEVIIPIINVQKYRTAFRGDRQVIFVLHKVRKIEDGTIDLAVYIAGNTDFQMSVAPGLRRASIQTALHKLYDNTEISVVINDQEVSAENPKPRIVANGRDDFLQEVQNSSVSAVRAKRLRTARQHDAGMPVTYHT
jgi:hypothetical protein